jgi:hypothetical protein
MLAASMKLKRVSSRRPDARNSLEEEKEPHYALPFTHPAIAQEEASEPEY